MHESSDDSLPTSRVDHVYRELRSAIIDGEYPPGAPLRHQDLTRVYGVSLIPIREAMRKLEMERLVEAVPNKGARVASISPADVQDVYATRIVLEQEALRRAMGKLGKEGLAEVRRWRDEMVSLVRRDDPAFYELHRRVHFAIYEASGSPWLLHMIEILWSHTERHRRLAARVRAFVDVGDDHHGRIIDAIATDDTEAALAALEDDLRRTSNLVIEAHRRS
ncbi:MAG: GntR family transcriptional regulator [Acidimicrobiia bacterium]